MATNILKSDSRNLTLTAGGTISAGDLVFIGADIVGVALADATSGAKFSCQVEGVVNVTKITGETWAEGDKIYAKPSTGACSKTYDATNYTTYIGVAVEAVGSAVLDGAVKLRGGAEAEVDLDDVVSKSLFDAHSILAATVDNVPAALTVGASTFIGRKSTGNIAAMSPAEARTELNVEDGADVTDTANVTSAGAVMDSELVHYQAVVANGNTSVTTTLAAAGFVPSKPIFGCVTNNTTNPCGLMSIYIDGTDFVTTVSADPGASTAIVDVWQDQR